MTSSKMKFGMADLAPKPKVKQCEEHGLWFEPAKGCVACRHNTKPDPER